MSKLLLRDDALERSWVVANSRMNRERGACGVNSYEKELLWDPVAFLKNKLQESVQIGWLDLCCGRGRALIEAGVYFSEIGNGGQIDMHGVDLVDMFDDIPTAANCVRLESSSLHRWRAGKRYDLITCIHGLHYVGDKLGLLQRGTGWLKEEGLFVANLDLRNFRLADGKPMGRQLLRRFRESGVTYDNRRHLFSCSGRRDVILAYRYLGADDSAGPNYSGHEAVDSYYAPID